MTDLGSGRVAADEFLRQALLNCSERARGDGGGGRLTVNMVLAR